MDTSSFNIGDVVEIWPCDQFEDFALRNKKGEVVDVDPERGAQCIRVKAGGFARGSYGRIEKGHVWCEPDELEIQEDGWTQEDRATFLFGSSWHSMWNLKFPWQEGNPCMHSAHDGQDRPPAVRRVMMNIWGSVCELDMCEEHLEYDGRCADSAPYGEPWRRKETG